MSETNTVTTETPHNPARTSSTTGAPAQPRTERTERGRLVQTVHHGSVIATPSRGDGAIIQTVKSMSSDAPRPFNDKLRTMLANLDKHGDVRGDVPDEGGKDEPAKPDAGAAEAKSEDKAKTSAPAMAPASTEKPASSPDATPDKPVTEPAKPDAELTSRAERLAEHNKRLVTEVEQLRAQRGAPEPDDRMKALDEIERGLTTDFVGSLRKLVALNAGIKDPASPDIDRLMAGGYYEWTSSELKLPLDDAKRAAIGSDRNRLLIDRDKRDRDAKTKADEEKIATEREIQKHAAIGVQLDKHLGEAKHIDKYPLMMKLSQRIDGMSPGALLWTAIRRGIAAGEFPQDTPDDKLIEHYSKEIEKHYTPIREAFADGSPSPSTSTATTQTPATVPPKDPAADAPQAGARTITNASASVAPPAPPVAATPPAETSRPGKNYEEKRRRQIAAKYFPD